MVTHFRSVPELFGYYAASSSWYSQGVLLEAVQQNDVDKVKKCLTTGGREALLECRARKFNYNSSCPDSTPHPLFEAVRNGNHAIINLLLDNGACINARATELGTVCGSNYDIAF